jgi:hypothetical protein
MSSDDEPQHRVNAVFEARPVRGRSDNVACAAFESWMAACAELRRSELRGDNHDTALEHSVAVIRARSGLIRDRIEAGWQPGKPILTHLACDEQLVQEDDDRSR